ncbi:heparanase-like [Chelonus insularis]|uniref:heparanase-like n=1 Tax=Chelonus insularis TaxID=460826 RepID=UPI00158865CB|nr:heparanase-like [Chelonus insularis]
MSYFENNIWNKNQYENIEKNKPTKDFTKSFFGFFIVGTFLLLLLICLWNIDRHNSSKTYIIVIDKTSELLYHTSDKFLSFGLDSSLLRDWKTFPVKNDMFANLARHLSPAFVRIGGTSADCLFFNKTFPISNKKIINPIDGQDISNFTLSEDDYLAIYKFTTKANLRMMFDLNVLIRTNEYWNDSNAREIINYSKGQDMMIDWQMGNEPNSFKHVFSREVSGKQLGKDYHHLRLLLNELGYDSSILVGPEVNHIGDENQGGELYATEFLKYNEDSVDFVTWHQYYLNGREATVRDFINPNVFNKLSVEINQVQRAIDTAGKKLQMWISETSTAFGGGAPELSDRFVAGFLWLDKLGCSASSGVNVVIRQSFFGGNYAMIGPDLQPNPDWWVSVFFKQFVSTKVIKIAVSDNSGHIRFYAHCTPESALLARVPAMTVYGMNLNNESVRMSIQGLSPYRNSKIFLYILTSDDLQSRNIMLNGEILKLRADGSLPPFKAIIVDSTQLITLPPYSMAFIMLHGVEVEACGS